MKKILLPLMVIFCAAVTVAAQTTQTQAPAAPAVHCPPTTTLDELIAAIDSSITGPADRDRTCFRDIFYPEARLMPIGKNKEGVYEPHILTVDDWINAVAKRAPAVLGEHQIRVEKVVWAHEAHLWSTYTVDLDGKVAARGINSIQAVNDGKRWRILSIEWQAEDDTDKVPEKFLSAGK